MDRLRNYPGFKQDIETAFKSLIEDFKLILTGPHEGVFLLKGLNCILRFTFDRGQIACQFKKASEDQNDPGYDVYSVYGFLYPLDKPQANNESNDDWDTKLQLSGYSNMITAKFKNILNGDFGWLNSYLKMQEREKQLTLYVFDLNREHPLYKKFWNGDPSWKDDTEKYLIENNIILKDIQWG